MLLVGVAFAGWTLFNAGDDEVFTAVLVGLIVGQTLLVAGLVVWTCQRNRSASTKPRWIADG
jgi:hypothetical protein